MDRRGNYAAPLAFVGLMFFAIGFALGINSFLVPALKASLGVSSGVSYLLVAATFVPFIIFGMPAAWVIGRIGYRRAMALAFGVFAFAFALLVLSAWSESIVLFLAASFVSGAANTVLQASVNPYITILGPIESAARRMSVMGICNKLAWPVAPLFFSLAVPDAANVSMGDLYLPFCVIIGVFAALGIVSLLSPLPEVKAAGEGAGSGQDCPYAAGKTSVWQFPHLLLGALTLFVYVGVETLSLATATDYAVSLGLDDADMYSWIPSVGMVVGYVCGIALIPKVISQDGAMRVCAVIGVAGSLLTVLLPGHVSVWMIFLMALGCSLMWPALWPLAMADLGRFTERGSGILTMAIAGGAVIPTAFGFLKDACGAQSAYWLAVPCFLFIFYYGFAGYKIRT